MKAATKTVSIAITLPRRGSTARLISSIIIADDVATLKRATETNLAARLTTASADVKLLGRIVGGFTFESVDKGTRLSRWTEADLGRGERLLAPLLVRVVRRFQRTELANLKRLIEAQPSPAASG